MATTISDVIFAICAVAIAVSQSFILRSTARGMKHKGSQRGSAGPALEWTYAVLPALALAALLVFSYRAMHPDTVRVKDIAPSPIGMGS